jgi:hypothetical protein
VTLVTCVPSARLPSPHAPCEIGRDHRLRAAIGRAARERAGPLPSIDVADALLDERCELAEWISEPAPDPSLVQG